MAFEAPDVTVFTLTTLTQAGLSEALYAHWAPSGASTKFTASDPTGAPTGAASFSLIPNTLGETWQMNFRTSSIAIDPGFSISDSSNPSASASDAWSGELSALIYGSSNGKIAIVEFDDALFVLISNADDSAWVYALHVGKLFEPFFTSDSGNGLSGLGILGRQPYYTTSGASPWFNPTVGQFGPDYQKIQLGSTTNEWLLPVQAFGGPAGYHIERDDGITEAEATLGTNTSAVPLILMQNSGGTGPCGDRPLGVMKYVYNWWNAATPKTQITDGNGTDLIHIWYINSAQRLLIPWDGTTTP